MKLLIKAKATRTKKSKKNPHTYGDSETARTRKLKHCNTCGDGFHGRPSVCPGCLPTERKLTRKYFG